MERVVQHATAAMADPITSLFVWTIVGTLGFFLVLAWVPTQRARTLCRNASGILTSLGVLGTFTGIFVGLMDFDVQAIDQSVPRLLAGMKLAFLTSLAGMACAIFYKIIYPLLERSEAVDDDVSGAHLLVALKQIRDGQKDGMNALRQAIAGEGDSSLNTQVARLRTTTGDGFADLKAEFRTFAETLAENNSKALIEALNSVIRDFNAKITEQFGENFKHLNQAVGRLLEWQETYRAHVETLTDRFEKAGSGIAAIETATLTIADKARAVPEAMERLSELMKAARADVDVLADHLGTFAQMREKAVNAFPIIEQNLERMTAGMKAQADAMTQAVSTQAQVQVRITEEMQKAVTAQTQTFATLRDGFADLDRTARQAVDGMKAGVIQALTKAGTELEAAVHQQGSAMKDASQAAGRLLTAAADEHHKAMQRSAEKHEATMSSILENTGKELANQITDFDKKMQDELTRCITLMGTHLTSLSNHFVMDYKPLTENLRRVLDVARGVA